MGIINELPEEIYSKIAAGEVVDRPASAVKELVENSIDAGATVINVEIKKGGTVYIRVTDNGKGMSCEDAVTAFKSHATSKVKTEADLDEIYTLGFRGEALASIGAVSKTELYTKRPGDTLGTHVSYHGGNLEDISEEGMPDGTTFEISNLFYNTPARMNFLKRDVSEAAAITDVMERFILSYPEISFRYTIDGKEKYFTSGDNRLLSSFYAVYGKSYVNSVIPVDYRTENITITGLIGKGDAARPNRSYQSFYVNRRYVKGLRLSNTLEAAYKNQIMVNKHPMAVLNIEINPRRTNVNVHPTKLEVRFSNEDEVYRAIFHAVENALYAMPNVPKIERGEVKSAFARDKSSTSEQMNFGGVHDNRGAQITKNSEIPHVRNSVSAQQSAHTAEFPAQRKDVKPAPPQNSAENQPQISVKEQPQNSVSEISAGGKADSVQNTSEQNPAPTAEQVTATSAHAANQTAINSARAATEQSTVNSVQTAAEPSSATPINSETEQAAVMPVPTSAENPIIAKNSYALNADNEFFDRRRAALLGTEADVAGEIGATLRETVEKISIDIINSIPNDGWDFDRGIMRVVGQIFNTYIIAESGDTMIIADQHAAHERLKYEELKKSLAEHKVNSQMLLVPVVVDTTAAEHATFTENTEKFDELGFEIEDFGGNALIVRATPEPLDSEELKQLVLEIINNLASGAQGVVSEKLDHALYTIACKAAVKANHRYDNKQLETLLNAVLDLGNINTCPHGRPIIVTMTKKELEREFKRIV